MRRPLFAVAVCLVICCAIWLKVSGATGETRDDFPADWSGESTVLTITGQVYQKEEDSIYLKSIIISNSNAFGQSAAESQQDISGKDIKIIKGSLEQHFWFGEELPGKFICEIDRAEEVLLGARVLIQGVLMPFSGASNPGEFDARKYYRSIGVTGRLEDAVILGQSEGYWPVREWLYGKRKLICERIYDVFPEQDAAVIEALLLGEKGNLDSDLKGLYQRNGILHILSISAMHVSVVGMSLYQLLRKLGVPIWLAAVCGSVVLLMYGALTGFGISAVRAIGMYLIRMLGEVVGRTYDMLTALGLVGAFMILYNPYYLQNGGFLLSFSCVLGIGVLYPLLLPDFRRYAGKNRALDTPWKKCMEWLRKAEFPKRFLSSFILSLSVTLATLPVQMYLYYEIPTFSVFLNLLVVPLLKPLMMSGIVALVLPWSVVFEWAVRKILGGCESACLFFDVLPYNTWNPGCPETWQMIAYYVLLLALIWWRRKIKAQEKQETKKRQEEAAGRRIHMTGCIVMVSLGVGILGMHPIRSNITFLDVGQGSCAVMQLSSGENYLFDCGSTGRSKVGQYVLLPFLKYAGIRCLDGVFVSHPDEDHSNGVLELFALCDENDIIVKQLILPDIADEASEEQLGELVRVAKTGISVDGDMAKGTKRMESGTRVAYISRGDTWHCEGARFLCLHPYKDYSGIDSNQYSECIYVEFRGRKWFGETVPMQSLLLTGDVGKEAEADLMEALKKYNIEDITVFQGAHHGSKYSNSEELLAIVRPEVTIISCGQNNSYGHPHKETLERLKNVGSTVLTTPEYGAITVEFGQKMVIRRWRK